MKRSFYLFAFVLSCVLNSCTQDAEVVYSCNEEINEWTIENLSMIQEMTRSEWLKLDENKKRAAYRGFTQQQRINFWIEKIEEVKSLDWSSKELDHIALITTFITEHQDLFSGNPLTDDQSDILYLFCYQWVEFGIEKLGWSKQTAISIIGTGNKVTDKKGGVKFDPGPIIDDKKDCCCHAGNILFSTCILDETCEKTKCIVSFGGCGWFLTEECNGECI